MITGYRGRRLAAVCRRPLVAAVNALLIGAQVAGPISEFGNGHVLGLPHYGVHIQVTTRVFNPAQTRYGIPDIVVAPTLTGWLAGRDPVLADALAYGRARGP